MKRKSLTYERNAKRFKMSEIQDVVLQIPVSSRKRKKSSNLSSSTKRRKVDDDERDLNDRVIKLEKLLKLTNKNLAEYERLHEKQKETISKKNTLIEHGIKVIKELSKKRTNYNSWTPSIPSYVDAH